jgi:hypothetical protein
MNVHTGLPPGFSYVHPDVIAVRSMFLVNNALRLTQERKNGRLLFRGQVEEIRDVALRDGQNVPACE